MESEETKIHFSVKDTEGKDVGSMKAITSPKKPTKLSIKMPPPSRKRSSPSLDLVQEVLLANAGACERCPPRKRWSACERSSSQTLEHVREVLLANAGARTRGPPRKRAGVVTLHKHAGVARRGPPRKRWSAGERSSSQTRRSCDSLRKHAGVARRGPPRKRAGVARRGPPRKRAGVARRGPPRKRAGVARRGPPHKRRSACEGSSSQTPERVRGVLLANAGARARGSPSKRWTSSEMSSSQNCPAKQSRPSPTHRPRRFPEEGGPQVDGAYTTSRSSSSTSSRPT
ncbi:serine/arginine repetitive matrix protein 1-like [Macrobrachium nipponense]|uniref:serine/arginine repetitive matrix protein 1-like n=1 Tax=Macrobrachium nipponense TaxID=159736 RepID=UPI0030C7B3A5